MKECSATVRFRTHLVHIRVDEHDNIHCFKYTHNRCEYETFTDQELAEFYIVAPFSSMVYELILEEEER